MVEIRNHFVYILYSNEHDIYIGITTKPDVRLREHYNGKGSSLVKQLLDRGFAFTFEILKSELTELEALNLEENLIAEYIELGYSVLNKCSGGQLGSLQVTGEKHHATKLKDHEVKELRELYARSEKPSQASLANKFNVSVTTVNNLITGKLRLEAGGPISINNINYSNQKLSDNDILEMRHKYSKTGKIVFATECKNYGITGAHMSRILRGIANTHVDGPILNRDYSW